MESCELTILMPVLNEAETLARCIKKARQFLDSENIHGEILIADRCVRNSRAASATCRVRERES